MGFHVFRDFTLLNLLGSPASLLTLRYLLNLELVGSTLYSVRLQNPKDLGGAFPRLLPLDYATLGQLNHQSICALSSVLSEWITAVGGMDTIARSFPFANRPQAPEFNPAWLANIEQRERAHPLCP